ACAPLAALAPDLVLVFGSVALLRQAGDRAAVRAAFPGALLAGCSTGGEIAGAVVEDGTCVVAALRLDDTAVQVVTTAMAGPEDSLAAGLRLGQALLAGAPQPPAAVLLFGRGTAMNGSALIDGLTAAVGHAVPVCGGLAGDDGAFRDTLVIGPQDGEAPAAVAVGFHGDRFRLQVGSFGGWQPFGPTRRVTRADGNILYSLDGEPALDVYRRYLGDHAAGLPATGLLFPFEMLCAEAMSQGTIRTILGIDEAAGSLLLAGDVEEGGLLRMMAAGTDALVDGAERAAAACLEPAPAPWAALALLVSCVGRKLVMGDRVDEEVEAVLDTLGAGAGGDLAVAGFYSYGELGPHSQAAGCRLHNQTMTVAVLGEA
ncbi:FIST signal transduction protein, partial [Caenispirillum bisanense]|uniref:FIST signal transduction protein n=1 Tax=Caenispirillum bisanense TaxID=414052 RepID=UPI0031D9579C